jgi:hypothetical protein
LAQIKATIVATNRTKALEFSVAMNSRSGEASRRNRIVCAG